MINVGRTIYILNKDTYIHCDHDTLEISKEDASGKRVVQKIPSTIIEQIIIFNSTTVSSYLIKYCSEHKILVSYISKTGSYYGGLRGKSVGNVLLRQGQYRLYDSPNKLDLVKNIVLGKSINQKNLIDRMYKNNVNSEELQEVSLKMSKLFPDIAAAKDIDTVRGIEGSIATLYFGVFDNMIKIKNTGMIFEKRSKRPPQNNCNALLSFLYTIMTVNCTAALESFGLDSNLGFLHEIRPGRESLSCDLVEEFRAPFVDHFVLNLINRKEITKKDFETVNDTINLTTDGKRKLFQKWEDFKNEKIYFPLYQQNVPRKVVPYLQAQLLAQFIRGDILEYPPYIWEE